MIILKVCCTNLKCNKRYKSHSRHDVNPSLNYIGNFSQLIITHEDIAGVKTIPLEVAREWKEDHPYGVLVLSYVRNPVSSKIRTNCDVCGAPVRAYAMWSGDHAETGRIKEDTSQARD